MSPYRILRARLIAAYVVARYRLYTWFGVPLPAYLREVLDGTWRP